MREIAFVGNGPVDTDVSDAVDRADHVVRFNKTRGFGGPTGRRVDDLFLVNCGGQMREWLRDAGFWWMRPLTATACVSLPVPAPDGRSGLRIAPDPSTRDGINYEHDVRRTPARPAHDRAHDARCAAPSGHRRTGGARRDRRRRTGAGPGPRPIWPSTGFLALYWYDRAEPPTARFTLHGFDFTGWRGHAWNRERDWVRRRMREGRMRMGRAEATAA